MKTKIIITLSALTLIIGAYFLIQNNFICFDKVCENTKIINNLNFEIPKLEKEIFEKQKQLSDLEKKLKEITEQKISLFAENNKIATGGTGNILKEEFKPIEQVPNFSTENLSGNVVEYEVLEPQKKN